MSVNPVDDILNDLRVALSVEPSEAFADRLRQIPAAEARLRWVRPAALAAAVAVLATAAFVSRATDTAAPPGVLRPQVELGGPASLSDGASGPGQPAAGAGDATFAALSPGASAGRSGTTMPPAASMAAPVVLVPDDQARAIARLLAARRQGTRLDVVATPTADEALPELGVPDIPEIEIPPLPAASRSPIERNPR